MPRIKKIEALKKNAIQNRIVGTAEDMIPFAWRNPVIIEDKRKISKVLKTMQEAESQRALSSVPAHAED